MPAAKCATRPFRRKPLDRERLRPCSGVEPDQQRGLRLDHRPPDRRWVREHQRGRARRVQIDLVRVGQLAERRALAVEQLFPADPIDPLAERCAGRPPSCSRGRRKRRRARRATRAPSSPCRSADAVEGRHRIALAQPPPSLHRARWRPLARHRYGGAMARRPSLLLDPPPRLGPRRRSDAASRASAMPPPTPRRRSRSPSAGMTKACDLLVFPELNLTSYAIDDLHLQDAIQRATEAALAEVAAATAKLRPVLLVGAALARERAALQLRGRDRARAHPRRRAQDLPAQLPRILRETLVRERRRTGRARRSRRRAVACRSAPT